MFITVVVGYGSLALSYVFDLHIFYCLWNKIILMALQVMVEFLIWLQVDAS